MKKSSQYVVNAILIIILTGFTVWYLGKTQIITPSSLRSLKIINCFAVSAWVYLCFLFISLIEKMIYSTFCNYSYSTAMLTTLHGALGSAVSPLKSAHFPLKVYFQKNGGLTFAQTLTGVTKCQIIFSATSVIVYAILMIFLAFSNAKIVINNKYFPAFWIVGVGFGANLSILVALALISRVEKLRIVLLQSLAFLIKIFNRKLNKSEFIQKKTERLVLFKEQTSEIFSRFYLYFIPSILYVTYMFVSCLAPYVSYLCVSGAIFSVAECFKFYILSLAITYLVNIIPLPGGCVVAEFVFSIVFAPITEQFLSQTLLLWRFSTYYIPTIINLAVFIFYSVKSVKQRV